MKEKTERNNVLVWGEHINIKHFVFALALSVTAVIVTLLLIPKDNAYRLIYGLVALVIAFIINVLLIKPKREVVIREVVSDDN